LSRKKAVYLGLLGLGVAALVADRVFFAPVGAEASSGESAPPAPGPAPTRPRTEAPEAGPPGKPLSVRVAKASTTPLDDADLPDAFHSRTSWISQSMMGPPVPSDPEAKPENTPHEHKLSMIFQRDDQYFAVIDRRQVKVGDTLEDGLIIKSISKEGVELQGSAGIVNLSMRSRP
jgi:hypothetical protein